MKAWDSTQNHVKHRPKMPSEYIDVFEYWEETLQINILHFSTTEKSMLQETNSISTSFSKMFLPVSKKSHAYVFEIALTKEKNPNTWKKECNTRSNT